MFSYDIKIRRINSTSSLKAFATIVVEGIMEIDGFKVINGKNGLFVSAPSHKGTIMEDGVKKDKYFDDVKFVGEQGLEFSNELKTAILNSYNNNSETTSAKPSQSEAVKAKMNAATEDESTNEGPARNRKPLWGF